MEESAENQKRKIDIDSEFMDGAVKFLENEESLKKSNLGDYLYYNGAIEFLMRSKSQKDLFIQSLFTRYNWNPNIADQWFKHNPSDEYIYASQTKSDLRQMICLNNNDIHIVNTLHKDFNIIHFGNYPIEMLRTQYIERDNTDKPYGLFIFPHFDWNGAFTRNLFVFNNFFDSLKKTPFLVRTIECATQGDVVKNLIRLDKKYGMSHKISFALVNAHADSDILLFGNPKQSDKFSYILKKDLDKNIIHDMRHFFIPHPEIILVACSTGQENGIAQKISQQLNAYVTAPDWPTSLINLSVQENGKALQFKVEYERGKTSFYKPNTKNIAS